MESDHFLIMEGFLMREQEENSSRESLSGLSCLRWTAASKTFWLPCGNPGSLRLEVDRVALTVDADFKVCFLPSLYVTVVISNQLKGWFCLFSGFSPLIRYARCYPSSNARTAPPLTSILHSTTSFLSSLLNKFHRSGHSAASLKSDT